jgi:leader peptidase (prepilin peptidase)/N-methyltransferase
MFPLAMSCYVAAATAAGAVVGTAVPRLAYRLTVPFGASPRSGCVHCGGPFSPGSADWVRPGRAHNCRKRPGAPPLATAAVTGVTAGLLAWSATVGWATVGSEVGLTTVGFAALLVGLALIVAIAGLGVLLAVVDLGCLRLPDPLVGALAGLTVLPLTLLAVTAGEPSRVGRGVLAAGACAGAYLLLAILPGGGLGFGDVKLATALGFSLGWIGWPAVVIGLVAPHLINGPIALALLIGRRARRRTALPFGPALLAGALLAVVAS